MKTWLKKLGVMLGTAAILVAVLGPSRMITDSIAQSVDSSFMWVKDVHTLWGSASRPYHFCWKQTNGDNITNVLLKIVRAETGEELVATHDHPRSRWVYPLGADNPCVAMKLPKNGTFIHYLKACQENGTCSEWYSSLDPARARVDGKVQKWWVYGFGDPNPPQIQVTKAVVLKET